MSAADRIYTSVEDERTIRRFCDALNGKSHRVDDEESIALFSEVAYDKWHVLRLALMFSFCRPGDPEPIALDVARTEDSDSDSTDIGRKGDYRLQQVTGKGKPNEDYTDLFRAVLSHRHRIDLFDRQKGEAMLHEWLARHIHRGVSEIRRRWREGEDVHAFLLRELTALAGDEAETLSAPAEPPKSKADIVNALAEMGIRSEVQDIVPGPRLSKYRLHLPVVAHFDALRSGIEKLALSLGLASQGLTLRPSGEPKMVDLFVPRSRETWRSIRASDLRDWASSSSSAVLPMWPGVDVLGQPICIDLAEATHLFVAGTTGSGKSVCLHALLCSLLLTRGPDRVRFCLIDPKRVELSEYRGLPHLWGNRIHVTIDDALMALDEIVGEMEHRTAEFERIAVRNIAGANARASSAFPYIVIVIEELADLIMQERGIEEKLVRLAQKGRSGGIHLILSTQRPDAKTFPGLLRSNIPSRIALAVQKGTESKIILDELGAERLLKPGDMLVRLSGAEPMRVHGVYLDERDVAQIVTQAKETFT